jgi:hypothetical protein
MAKTQRQARYGLNGNYGLIERTADLSRETDGGKMDSMKKVIHLFCGVCWFLASVIFGFFLLNYIANGAGLQFFPLGISSGGVLLGMVHVAGFVAGAVISFSLGACLCARAIVGNSPKANNSPD